MRQEVKGTPMHVYQRRAPHLRSRSASTASPEWTDEQSEQPRRGSDPAEVRLGQGPDVVAHTMLLQQAARSQPTRIEATTRQFQRRYGNRYVEQEARRARQAEEDDEGSGQYQQQRMEARNLARQSEEDDEGAGQYQQQRAALLDVGRDKARGQENMLAQEQSSSIDGLASNLYRILKVCALKCAGHEPTCNRRRQQIVTKRVGTLRQF